MNYLPPGLWQGIAGVVLAMLAASCYAQDRAKPRPTHADVKYGPHERNVLDFWQAEAKKSTPLVVFIHGGGFLRGSKDQLHTALLNDVLDAGISVAAVNYRFANQAPLPAAYHDGRRALQFLRTRADEWNVDKSRVAAFGNSAGAQLSMYLAFHEETANPDSGDPVERESTRLTCVATLGGQTTVDLQWREKNIPGYAENYDPQEFFERFRVSDMESYLAKGVGLSALALISRDDPPIFMSYGMGPNDPIPRDAEKARNWVAHHVRFGLALKEKMDALGIESYLSYPNSDAEGNRRIADFFKAHLHAAR